MKRFKSGFPFSFLAPIGNLPVTRQDNVTNSNKNGSVLLVGWGVFAVGVVNNKSETVTFGVTFKENPIVLISYGGDDTAGSTTYGVGGNEDQGAVCIKAHTITTTNFVAHAHTADGVDWQAATTVFYQWMAIGELK